MSGRLTRFATAVEHLLPGVPFDTVLPWRRAIVAEAGVTPVPRGTVRLVIGPENAAGQGRAWAAAASSLAGVGAVNVMIAADGADPWGFPADHRLGASLAAHGAWQRAQARRVRQFTHALLESGKPLYRGDRGVDRHIERLKEDGLTVGLVWHGSDIRLPSAHAATLEDSPFGDGQYPHQQYLEERASANLALARSSRGHQFVSTPDLLEFLPDASWLPVVVDAQRWTDAAAPTVLERERPVVVHAPSNAAMKGTMLIREQMRELHDDGHIEYRELTGLNREQMVAAYGDADMVLDQFRLGSYGVAACEAMASGKVVIGFVTDRVRALVRNETAQELPIVSSRAADLQQTVRTVLDERGHFQGMAAAGATFVNAVHSGARAAQVLSRFLGAGAGWSTRAWDTGMMPTKPDSEETTA